MASDLDIQSLLDLAAQLEESGVETQGILSGLEGVYDPELLQALGELGLSEDLGVLGALEDSTRVSLEAGEQRNRLDRRQTRQQELTGANLSERGIPINDSAREGGLVAHVAQELGRRQGEQGADFEAAVGDDLRNILLNLGRGQVGNIADLGGNVLGAVGRNLQSALDDANNITTSQ